MDMQHHLVLQPIHFTIKWNGDNKKKRNERRKQSKSCAHCVLSDTVMERACCCTKLVINLSKDFGSWLFHMLPVSVEQKPYMWNVCVDKDSSNSMESHKMYFTFHCVMLSLESIMWTPKMFACKYSILSRFFFVRTACDHHGIPCYSLLSVIL